jgi:hypothetical protein
MNLVRSDCWEALSEAERSAAAIALVSRIPLRGSGGAVEIRPAEKTGVDLTPRPRMC